MTQIEKIQAEIESLPQEEYRLLRQWFTERDWEKWDQQIEANAASGKLDFLVNEVMIEKQNNKLRDL